METNPSERAQRLQNLQEIAAKILGGSPAPGPAEPASSEAAQPAAAAPDPGAGNAAIDRCLAAHAEASRKARAAGKSSSEVSSAGRMAYLRALPPLVGPLNVADFVACIMRASIENIILAFEINGFLYAAQVANCVKNPSQQPAPKRPRGRPFIAKTTASKASRNDNSSVNTQAESLK